MRSDSEFLALRPQQPGIYHMITAARTSATISVAMVIRRLAAPQYGCTQGGGGLAGGEGGVYLLVSLMYDCKHSEHDGGTRLVIWQSCVVPDCWQAVLHAGSTMYND
jgi:hypothetical protein